MIMQRESREVITGNKRNHSVTKVSLTYMDIRLHVSKVCSTTDKAPAEKQSLALALKIQYQCLTLGKYLVENWAWK